MKITVNIVMVTSSAAKDNKTNSSRIDKIIIIFFIDAVNPLLIIASETIIIRTITRRIMNNNKIFPRLNIAASGPKKSIGRPPKSTIRLLIKPYSPAVLKISNLNIVADATVGIAQGIKIVALAIPLPLNFLFKTKANTKPKKNSIIRETIEKNKV